VAGYAGWLALQCGIVKCWRYALDEELALRIKPSILNSLKGLLETEDYKAVAINLSGEFSICVEGIRDLLPQETTVTYMIGTLDERDKQLGEWIEKVRK
jgi:hypothetical protein